MKHPSLDSVKNSHCSYCGSKFLEQNKFPRRCFICWNDTYQNPIPVVVVIMPVYPKDANDQCGWLIGKREIEPGKGGWAFIGGYMEMNETYQQAAAREIKEEIGLETKPEDYIVQDIKNDSSGHLIIFCYHKGVCQEDIHFVPNAEVSEIAFPIEPSHQLLCFATHQEMWQQAYDYTFM